MSWWDEIGTKLGDALAAPHQPFGTLAPYMPAPTPQDRQQQIGSTLLALGAAFGQGARERRPFSESLGMGFANAQQMGANRQNQQLQGMLVGSKLQEAQRASQTREALKRNTALLQSMGLTPELIDMLPPDQLGKLWAEGVKNKRMMEAYGLGTPPGGGGDAPTAPGAAAATSGYTPPSGRTISADYPYPVEYGYNVTNLRAGDTPWEGKGAPFLHPRLKDHYFETFADPVQGVRAATKNLLYHVKNSGVRTFDDLGIVLLGGKVKDGHITPARPDGGKDSSAAWGTSVAGRLGMKGTDPLPLNDPQAMARVLQSLNITEHGRQTVPTEAYLAGVTAAMGGQPGAPSPVQPVQYTPPAGGPQQGAGSPPQAPGSDPEIQSLQAAQRQAAAAGQWDLVGQLNKEIARRRGQLADRPHEIEKSASQGRQRQELAKETKEYEDAIQSGGEFAKGIQNAGMKSRTTRAYVQQLGALLAEEDTGKFTSTIHDVKRVAKGLGINIEALGIKDNTGVIEAAKAVVNKLILDAAENMKGALSDNDIRFLTTQVPGIDTSPEGRKLQLQFMMRLHDYNIALAKVVQKYMESPEWKTNPRAVARIAQEWADANPIFNQADIDAVTKVRNAGRQPVPTQPTAGSAAPTAMPQAPQPGQIEDGYRFKGGNPADPKAWEKVQGADPRTQGSF